MNNDFVVDDSWIPQTPLEWFGWLSSEERKTRESYLAKPANLIADYRREKAIADDYEGREILELLQNAADQAEGCEKKGEVIIELCAEGLVFGNTGTVFSVGGVQSLQTAHLSPKWRARRPLIGNKGLGFRSILNWSHSPIIMSGGLNLVYSKVFASKAVSDLIESSTELAQRVLQEQESEEEPVIPLLPFPSYNESGDVVSLVENEPARVILGRCQHLRQQGYDTVVGMPFDNPDSYTTAREQIEKLRPEILLFVKHIGELRFLLKDVLRVWSLEGEDSLSLVLENDLPLGMWQIHRDGGVIPEVHLDKDEKRNAHKREIGYELVVAVPDVTNTAELRTATLFSHFPTSIELPLPVICHATLHLNQSRTHTLPKKSNKYVLDQLAAFLAEVAERRSKEFFQGPNAGFRLLLPLKDFPNDLTREKFPDQINLAAKHRAIVPTLGGQAVLPAKAKFVPCSSTAWLPKSSFGDVVAVCDAQEEQFFKALDVPVLSVEHLKTRLIAIKNLSLSDRASLIAGLLQHPIGRKASTSSLLLDTDGMCIPDQAHVFLAPVAGITVRLPGWMELRFLHDGLRSELSAVLKTQDVRDLQGTLADFGLLEYSLANLIRRIIPAATRRKNEHRDETLQVDLDLRKTIFALYRSESNPEKRPDYPENAPLMLPDQAGGTSAATTLYIGEGYGTQGNIVQDLYAPWALEKLVVGPNELGLSDDSEELFSFLKWVRVAEWPREVSTLDPNDGYRDYLLRNLRYPVKFEEYFFRSLENVERPRVAQVHSVDGLKEFLQHAEPAAITAWLALDQRAHLWNRRQTTHAKLSARRGDDRNDRFYIDPLPGYLHWKIENTSWMRIERGEKVRPKDCVLGQRAIEALFPRPLKPTPDIALRYGITDKDLLDGWRRSGVLTSLAELELEEVYSRLMELPQRDPQGRSAKSLYRWLLDASDLAMGNGADARAAFIKNGKMWGHYNTASDYYPVSELRHIDSDGLPLSLTERLKVVDLPFRVGADKVERFFGVRPVERHAIEQRVIDHDVAADFDGEFQRAKPFFFLLRASQSSQTQYLRALKSLSLKICFEINATMRYEGAEFHFVPDVWGWLIDRDVLYVRSDPAEPLSVPTDLLADAIGEAIASIFRIGDGGEFARMFLCKDKDRRTLLKRMRGETAGEDMDKIIAEFGIQDSLSRVAALPADIPIKDPVSTAGGLPEKKDSPQTPEPPKTTDSVATNGASSDPLIIEGQVHQPIGQQKRTNLRVQRTTGGPHRTPGMYRITDGDFCEKKAMEFEEGDEPPRYPLRVGQLTGASAFGCDILSFATHEDREIFRLGPGRDLGKVLRFIEVKGRKSEGGAIELKGNQRSAATTHNVHFFLYRLYKSAPDQYQMSILGNPLHQKEALEPAVYVDLNRAIATQRFLLTGGLQENSEGGVSQFAGHPADNVAAAEKTVENEYLL